MLDLISDANIVIKWFHEDGEEDVEPARALLAGQRERTAAIRILDLTPYEVGNALLRGRPRFPASRVAVVLDALRDICPTIAPTREDFGEAAELAEAHSLTLYDAVYSAVARRRNAQLVTVDRELLRAGLGFRPSQIAKLL